MNIQRCLEWRHHGRRVASGWMFACAVYDAATHVMHLLPDNLALRAGVAIVFLIFLDEETAAALHDEEHVPVVLVAADRGGRAR